jgi:predicted aldo/keto reductase-like oxidoreductase
VDAGMLIRYALGLPISVAVIGVASVDQLKENVRIVRKASPMTRTERQELETLMG